MTAGSLTRFQRILLGTDGTVTHILEAYAGEPVEVVKLRQGFEISTEADGVLDLAPQSRVLRRRVVLCGGRSGQRLLYAEAVIVPERLQPEVLEGLTGTDRPIGALLAEYRTETFREILRLGQEPAGACAPHLGVSPSTPVIFRTYRIVAGQRPVMCITEKFPVHCFRDLPE